MNKFLISTFSIGFIYFYYKLKNNNNIFIFCKNIKKNIDIINKCTLMHNYKVSTWGKNKHIQILLTFLIPQKKINYKKEIIILDDEKICLDWNFHNINYPIIIIIPGLLGDSHGMENLCELAYNNKYNTVIYNRHCYNNSLQKFYLFGTIENFKKILNIINKRYPNLKLYCIGYSAGTGLIINYLGVLQHESLLYSAVVISPGYDVLDTFKNKKTSKFYNYLLSKKVKNILNIYKNIFNTIIDYNYLNHLNCIIDIEEYLYNRFNKNLNVYNVYFKNILPSNHITNIKKPTLFINSIDDPICTIHNIPYNTFLSTPHIILLITRYGSHCGFFDSNLNYWSNQVAIEFFNNID